MQSSSSDSSNDILNLISSLLRVLYVGSHESAVSDTLFDVINGNAETVPSYDAKAISKVNDSSKVHEQMRHEKCKTIIQTSNDDQIDSNIIFDYPYVETNGGTSDHDSNDHDDYHKIQMLAYDVQREAENKKQLNNELKKQKMLLQKELEMCKDLSA
ncbi:hypothetical protein Tco_1427955 [Tanacetum coccineum]